MTTRGRLAAASLVMALAMGVFAVAGFTVRPAPVAHVARASAGAAPLADPAGTATSVAALQSRLRRLPRDHDAWATLGVLYVQQARLSADPSYYPKAQGAFERSLELAPTGNALALTGMASLAAARHDFAAAERYARRAKASNPYGAANQGVLSDALIEQGHYAAAEVELQRMLDLKPGVASLTRASYYLELHGRTADARAALEQAAAIAATPSDAAYALYYLGELAFNAGRFDSAAAHYAEGLRRDPSYVPLLAGRAKVAAAQGRTGAALRDYAEVVRRLPQPLYVIEYGDLLTSLGRPGQAQQQYALADAEQRLFRSAGVDVDLELALFDADHGRPAQALHAASHEWRKRRSIQVEDVYAWALHVNGSNREALVHAEAAARTGMHNALFAYHRGVIEESLGMDAAARRSLMAALRINPQFSPLQVPKARAALARLGVPS